jgi:NAD(P)-dependent dehydrogenase (short-subunit alcohol dehydrogenase family)
MMAKDKMGKRGVLITGGTKGLGRALSLAFGQAGYHVSALYSKDHAAADRLIARFGKLDIDGECHCHDVANPTGFPAHMVPDVESLTFIHNAGAAFIPAPLHTISLETFQKQWNVAVGGMHHGLHGVLRQMVRQHNGVIIGVLSEVLTTETPPPGFSAYASAKAGLKTLLAAMGQELGRHGICTVGVALGFMETEMTKQWPAMLKKMAAGASGPVELHTQAQSILQIAESVQIEDSGRIYPL